MSLLDKLGDAARAASKHGLDELLKDLVGANFLGALKRGHLAIPEKTLQRHARSSIADDLDNVNLRLDQDTIVLEGKPRRMLGSLMKVRVTGSNCRFSKTGCMGVLKIDVDPKLEADGGFVRRIMGALVLAILKALFPDIEAETLENLDTSGIDYKNGVVTCHIDKLEQTRKLIDRTVLGQRVGDLFAIKNLKVSPGSLELDLETRGPLKLVAAMAGKKQ
ncbi:MAG: hypothetical protein ABIJ09_24270 [Pseudomonadota bacterium]